MYGTVRGQVGRLSGCTEVGTTGIPAGCLAAAHKGEEGGGRRHPFRLGDPSMREVRGQRDLPVRGIRVAR